MNKIPFIAQLKSEFGKYVRRVHTNINHYITRNEISQKTRVSSTMEVSSMNEKLNGLNNALKRVSISEKNTVPFIVIDGFKGWVENLSSSNLIPKIEISLTETQKQSLELFKNGTSFSFLCDGSAIGDNKVYSDKNMLNDIVITDSLKNSDGVFPSWKGSLVSARHVSSPDVPFISTNKITINGMVKKPIEIGGLYSMLPPVFAGLKEEIKASMDESAKKALRDAKMADRHFINSILSSSIYTASDNWVMQANADLANGKSIDVNEFLKSKALDSNTDFEKVVAAFYVKTFKPARIMDNGKFESSVNNRARDVDFDFKDGVYRARDNICASTSMLSENEDGTYTLHMAYRGTDADSRGGINPLHNEKIEKIPLIGPAIRKMNNMVRFANYVVTAYSDMGRHHDNFEPFEKACLEFAKDPKNKISKIEVSGHSLGGAMVQRFLMSDTLKESGLGDKVEAVTWGAPQTKANKIGQALVAVKRVIEDAAWGVAKVAKDTTSEFILSLNRDVDENGQFKSNLKTKLWAALYTPVLMANLAAESVKAIPKLPKLTAKIAKMTYQNGVDVAQVFNKAAEDTRKELDGLKKDIQFGGHKDISQRTDRENLLNKLFKIPDAIVTATLAVPKSMLLLSKRMIEYAKDVDSSANFDNMTQYQHHKDPIPILTSLVANEVGNTLTLGNLTDTMPVYRQMVSKGNEVNEDILKDDFIPQESSHGFVKSVLIGTKIFGQNIIGHLSTDKHNMSKYILNTMMKESFFRRVNVNEDNPRFNSFNKMDEEWLSNTKNITKFETLLHDTRLEERIIQDALEQSVAKKNGSTFVKEKRTVQVADWGKSLNDDGKSKSTRHMTATLLKLEKLYGAGNSSLTSNYLQDPTFNLANTHSMSFNVQRTAGQKAMGAANKMLHENRMAILSKNVIKAFNSLVLTPKDPNLLQSVEVLDANYFTSKNAQDKSLEIQRMQTPKDVSVEDLAQMNILINGGRNPDTTLIVGKKAGKGYVQVGNLNPELSVNFSDLSIKGMSKYSIAELRKRSLSTVVALNDDDKTKFTIKQ